MDRQVAIKIDCSNSNLQAKIFRTTSDIIHQTWNHKSSKCPNEVEVHTLTQDEHLFEDPDFLCAYFKMKVVALKHYQGRTPIKF